MAAAKLSKAERRKQSAAKQLPGAVRRGGVADVARFVSKKFGADPNMLSDVPHELTDGIRLLHMCETAAVARALLDGGADPSLRTRGGYQALAMAAMHGRFDVVEVLLAWREEQKKGPQKKEGAEQDKDEVKERGVVDIDDVPPHGGPRPPQGQRGGSALLIAVVHNHTRVAKLLLQAGARTDVDPVYGYDPLFAAVSRNNEELVNELLLPKNKPRVIYRSESCEIWGRTTVVTARSAAMRKLIWERLVAVPFILGDLKGKDDKCARACRCERREALPPIGRSFFHYPTFEPQLIRLILDFLRHPVDPNLKGSDFAIGRYA